MKITPEQQENIKNLLLNGEQIEAVKYLQNNLHINAAEALSMVEKLQTSLAADPAMSAFKAMNRMRLKHQSGSKLGKGIGLFFMFCGLIMLGVTAYIFYGNYQFAQTAVPVVGKVVDFSTHESSDDDGGTTTMYTSIFEYEYEGQTYTHYGEISSSSPDYDLGEEVEVLVDPELPNKALVNAFWDRWFTIVLLGIMGSIFTGMGFMATRLA